MTKDFFFLLSQKFIIFLWFFFIPIFYQQIKDNFWPTPPRYISCPTKGTNASSDCAKKYSFFYCESVLLTVTGLSEGWQKKLSLSPVLGMFSFEMSKNISSPREGQKFKNCPRYFERKKLFSCVFCVL